MHRSQSQQIHHFTLILSLALAACAPSSNQVSTSDGMLIEPGIGVGPIRLGMKMEDVRTLLGEPEVRIATTMQFEKLGLAVIPKKSTEVGAIMMGDSGGSYLVDAFKGETKDGIRMGTNRQAIIDVYGEPKRRPVDKMIDIEEGKQGMESLRYPDQGLTFVLRQGRLVHITLR